MSKNIENKREREKRVVSLMIQIYCRNNHGNKHTNKHRDKHGNNGEHGENKDLCPECTELMEYAVLRSDKCPFMETKTFCSNCKVHCYKPEMRERIRTVMRYSGPRMIFHHPVMAVRHVVESKKEKKRLEENNGD